MDFWDKQVNVSREAASRQIAIVSSFAPEKRFKIALEFADLGVSRTREWIKEKNPNYSPLEITLEFVRLIYYSTGQMTEEDWLFYRKHMEQKIKNDWSRRFRVMMKNNNWDYDDIAKMGGFKNGSVIKSTISRGLPSFAKLAVMVYESISNKK